MRNPSKADKLHPRTAGTTALWSDLTPQQGTNSPCSDPSKSEPAVLSDAFRHWARCGTVCKEAEAMRSKRCVVIALTGQRRGRQEGRSDEVGRRGIAAARKRARLPAIIGTADRGLRLRRSRRMF